MNSTPPSPVSLYEEALAAANGQDPVPQRPPRASAAVVLWRRGSDGVEVFWIRRSPTASFMPAWHAFPGGAVSKGDATLPLVGRVSGPEVERSVLPEALRAGDLGPDLSPAIVAAALRELLEECRLPVVDRGLDATQRTRLIAAADTNTLAPALAQIAACLDASQLVFAGRWLTPPFAPVRFDNRFFLLEWPAAQTWQPEIPAGGELAGGEWISPHTALEAWRRGELLAAPPILHILEVLATDGPTDGRQRLWEPVEADLGPMRRIEFRPGVVMFPLRTLTLPPAATTNCYLIGTGDHCVVVDPGSPFDADAGDLEAALAAAATKLGRKVAEIWLTHHHPDHIGGVERLRRVLGVPVRAHRDSQERLSALGITVDAFFTDGQIFDLGSAAEPMSVQVHHCPGHARGHVAFLVERDSTLLCGDITSAISTIVIDPPEGNMADYLASIRRLVALAPKTLLPGHGPAVLDGTAHLHHLIAHRLEREQAIRAAFLAGYHEPPDIFPLVYRDGEVPPAARPLAHRQIRAHLEHLADQGQLTPG